MKVNKRDVEKVFAEAAAHLNWDITSPVWVKREADETSERGFYGTGSMKATIGRVVLQKHGSGNRYSIVSMSNVNGGERTVRYSCAGAEMYLWLRGVCDGCQMAQDRGVLVKV